MVLAPPGRCARPPRLALPTLPGLAWGLALLVLVGCGDPAKSSPPDASSGDAVAVDAPPDVGKGADSGATDAGGQDTLGGADVQDGGKDASEPGLPCATALPCLLACPTANADAATCAQQCAKPLSAQASSQLQALAACSVALCAEATSVTERNGCVWGKCLDTLSTCGQFGQGTGDCLTAASCASRCNQNNPACWTACMQAASAAEVQAFGPLAQCILGPCGTVQGDAKAACIQQKCTGSAQACRGPGGGLDCTFAEGCLAKCPPVVPGSVNDCRAVCGILTSPVGLAADATYTACKQQCAGVLDKFDCYKDKCSAEQEACFSGPGSANCQAIYKCVVDQCEGIGGTDACIAGCVADGSAKAKDGWVHYEGCILQHLDTAEARNAGCSFPYDESTCLGVVKGFCAGETAACFKPQ